MEITLGSFLHTLRLPFSGTSLAAVSAALLVAQRQMLPRRGLSLTTGIVAAVCKSVSPGGVIFGPMVGITVEAARWRRCGAGGSASEWSAPSTRMCHERGIGAERSVADDDGSGRSGLRRQRVCDVVLVDELGRLEARGDGHAIALKRLAGRPGRAAVLLAAVRKDCLGAITETFGEPALVVEAPLDDETLHHVLERIVMYSDRAAITTTTTTTGSQ